MDVGGEYWNGFAIPLTLIREKLNTYDPDGAQFIDGAISAYQQGAWHHAEDIELLVASKVFRALGFRNPTMDADIDMFFDGGHHPNVPRVVKMDGSMLFSYARGCSYTGMEEGHWYVLLNSQDCFETTTRQPKAEYLRLCQYLGVEKLTEASLSFVIFG